MASRLLSIVVTVLFTLSVPPSTEAAPPPKKASKVRIKSTLESLKGALGRLTTAGGKEVAGWPVVASDDIRAVRDALEVLRVLGYDPFQSATKKCEAQPAPTLASGAQIASIENSLSAASTDVDRVLVLRLAARSHRFSAAQTGRLLGAINTAEPRADALIALHGALLERHKFHTLLSLITVPEQRRRVVESTKGITER